MFVFTHWLPDVDVLGLDFLYISLYEFLLSLGELSPFFMLLGRLFVRMSLTCLVIQNLRYKDYQFLRSEAVEQGQLLIQPGKAKEFESMKALAAELGQCGILDWWNRNMGFKGEG